MNPFSPWYFIKENKTRCILLIFMIFLGYGAYLGGLYITNPLDSWSLDFAYFDNMVRVTQALDDVDGENYKNLQSEVIKDDQAKFIHLAEHNGLKRKSIMGFEMTVTAITFCSVDDFKTFDKYHGIDCDFNNIKNGSMIMSEKLAKNKGLEIGDKIDKDYDINIYREYTLDAITSEDGYTLYFINETSESSSGILLGTKIKGKELYDYADMLSDKYNVDVYDDLYKEIKSQFSMFMPMYTFVVILMAVIMAVTINAAFVGMYQKRTFEFAVYRAIGITRKQMIGKIVGELLCMDVIALFVGGGIFFLALYLFNHMVLYPIGQYLDYFHSMAFLGLALCNVTIIIPLIVSRCRRLLKADICEY